MVFDFFCSFLLADKVIDTGVRKGAPPSVGRGVGGMVILNMFSLFFVFDLVNISNPAFFTKY